MSAGGRPIAHETVVAYLDEERVGPGMLVVQNECRAETDDAGHFVIERLAPGEARINWQPGQASTRKTVDRYYQPNFVDVVSGQTTHVDLKLEGGRPLVGRFAVPKLPGHRFEVANNDAYLLPKLPDVPYPREIAPEDRREWLSHWRLTREATAYRHRKRGFAHSLKVQPDGSFRVDEVEPGSYVLHVRNRGFSELVRNVEIPKPIGGPQDEPVDLGILSLKR